jgi:hypothetical protein
MNVSLSTVLFPNKLLLLSYFVASYFCAAASLYLLVEPLAWLCVLHVDLAPHVYILVTLEHFLTNFGELGVKVSLKMSHF